MLIDVFLAEVALDDSVRYGIEWSRFVDTRGTTTHDFIGVNWPPPDPLAYTGGFLYSITDVAGRFSAAISAAAVDNRLRVISSPHILASNNKEAKIQIGKEQPILTNTYTGAGDSNVITGSIEYKDVGIILTVTPRISDAGMTTLDIQIEDSNAEETQQIGTEGSLLTVPVIRKKTAKTTISVAEGQMIVIGGLISDTKNVGSRGIPFLSKIPVIGGFFGRQNYINVKTETILLMTPHTISDQTKAKTVTDDFQNKLRTIRKEMEERDKKR